MNPTIHPREKMKFTIFSKKQTTKEGKTFYRFLATLTRKDGTSQTVAVKFRDECGAPKPEKCPMNIIVDRGDANLSKKEFVKPNGDTVLSCTLWVSRWEMGDPYIDKSLDEFI